MQKEIKFVVFNAEDFGISYGANKGIFKVLSDGRVVRSTSVLVNGLAASDARELNQIPKITIGLHLDFTGDGSGKWKRLVDFQRWPKRRKIDEFMRQVDKFGDLLGRPPDHIDGHHNIQIFPGFRDDVYQYASDHNIMVRSVDYPLNLGFHGRRIWQGNLGRGITPDDAVKLLKRLPWGVTCFACHPGYVDEGLIFSGSRYINQRETELNTLRSPKLLDFLEESKDTIEIINTKQILRR
jgi:predicted glycoside hydrolase/deacetylase ChbG (UPF0249 family)